MSNQRRRVLGALALPVIACLDTQLQWSKPIVRTVVLPAHATTSVSIEPEGAVASVSNFTEDAASPDGGVGNGLTLPLPDGNGINVNDVIIGSDQFVELTPVSGNEGIENLLVTVTCSGEIILVQPATQPIVGPIMCDGDLTIFTSPAGT